MKIIKNYSELIAHGQGKVRRDALEIIQKGIEGADPGKGVYKQLRLDGNNLNIGDKVIDLTKIHNIYFVGTGKGSFPIAQALEEMLGSRIKGGVLSVKSGEKRRLARIEVIEAGHPLPNENSVLAGRKIFEVAQNAGENDLVFAGVTGGASALLILPPPGISLNDLQCVNQLLLKSGANIREMNAVRKHLCLLKGGRLVATIQPAMAVTLTLDTAPEGLPWPDLCLADPTTFQDAIETLHYFDLWEKVPKSVQVYLEEGKSKPERETVKSLAGMKATLLSVGDPVSACETAARKAKELGYTPIILSTNIEGDSAQAGICLSGIVKEIIKFNRPFPKPCALISGGETTVTITGKCGEGGPNQEFALAFAQQLGSKPNVCCIAVDTDGTDGPTDIAGGIVDGDTSSRASKLKISIPQTLKDHDSSKVLKMLGDSIITGHTGTNIMNLRAIIIAG
jgi:glycerate-2-kinase